MIRIRLGNITKKFNIDFKKNEGILARILGFFPKATQRRELVVLNNISLQAKTGEIIGIIGKNGSGKSTLLKIIAGVYLPNEGEVEANGRMVYLTGLGQGLVPKLTMRENIFMMGSIMGLGQKDIKNKFDEIVDLSGLKEFLDTKVMQFSSGMITRLNFSVMIHSVKHHNPEIILLDEVFGSGGDIEFQNRGIEKMEELIRGGATVIMASHALDTIKKYCDRVLWIDSGIIKSEGPPEKVTLEYEQSFNKK